VLPAFSQDEFGIGSRPDVFITVRKSQVGADYIRIQMVEKDYPAEVFRKQCEAVGVFAGGQIRGLDVTYTNAGTAGRILGAEFAADRIIDRTSGVLDLNSFAKAFAGAPSPYTVDTLAIVFEQETPKEGVTLRAWDGPTATVEAKFEATIPAVDYRVTLKTQDPSKIAIPRTLQDQTNAQPAASKEQPRASLIPWVVGGGVLAGLAVYFALRPSRAPRAEKPRRE
jgi:hypothetical protein